MRGHLSTAHPVVQRTLRARGEVCQQRQYLHHRGWRGEPSTDAMSDTGSAFEMVAVVSHAGAHAPDARQS